MLIVSVTYILIILFFLIVFYLKLTFGFDYIMKCEGIEKELKWHLLYYGNLSLILWKYISYIMENRIVFSAVCLHSCSHYLLSLYLV